MVVLLSGGKLLSRATGRREAARVSGTFPLDLEVGILPGWGARGCYAGRAVHFSSEEGLPSTLTVQGWAGTAPCIGVVEMTLERPGTGFHSSAPVWTGMVVLLSGGKSLSMVTGRREAAWVLGAFPLDLEVRIPPGWGARGCRGLHPHHPTSRGDCMQKLQVHPTRP